MIFMDFFSCTSFVKFEFLQYDICTCTGGQVWTEVTSIKQTKSNFLFLPGLEKPCMESWSLNTFRFSSFVKHDRQSMLWNVNDDAFKKEQHCKILVFNPFNLKFFLLTAISSLNVSSENLVLHIYHDNIHVVYIFLFLPENTCILVLKWDIIYWSLHRIQTSTYSHLSVITWSSSPTPMLIHMICSKWDLP